MAVVTVASEFAYVVFMLIASAFVNVAMGFGVGAARKKYKVPYPTMYASAQEHGADNANAFNCTQRGHQNVLENYPVFIMLSVLSGLQWPLVTAGAQALYTAGKWMYFKGYSTGDPAKRMQGSIAYIGLITMIVGSVAFGVSLL